MIRVEKGLIYVKFETAANSIRRPVIFVSR
jgi:hypothetical protein